MQFKNDLATIVAAKVGDVANGEDSISGRIRRFYTKTYKSLDQFDQLWYECRYEKRDPSWLSCYTWAVVLDCVLNARSAYCENRGSVEPLKTFIVAIIKEIQEYVKKL